VGNRLSSTYFWSAGGPFRYGQHETGCDWLAAVRLADLRPLVCSRSPSAGPRARVWVFFVRYRSAPHRAAEVFEHARHRLVAAVAPLISDLRARLFCLAAIQGRPTAGSGSLQVLPCVLAATACDRIHIRNSTSHSCTCSIAWCARGLSHCPSRSVCLCALLAVPVSLSG
jgi:hypothetical protein